VNATIHGDLEIWELRAQNDRRSEIKYICDTDFVVLLGMGRRQWTSDRTRAIGW
jgi:hypothetical protein